MFKDYIEKLIPHLQIVNEFTHLPLVPHIYIYILVNQVSIGSDNDLSPIRQAII